MPKLPKPMSAEQATAIAEKKRKEEDTVVMRTYRDANGVEHPWMYEGNPALWKDSATGADWEDD